MASIRNIVAENNGTSWDISFEYSNDSQTAPWQTFTAKFPRDFDEIPADQLQSTMVELGRVVAVAQGVLD